MGGKKAKKEDVESGSGAALSVSDSQSEDSGSCVSMEVVEPQGKTDEGSGGGGNAGDDEPEGHYDLLDDLLDKSNFGPDADVRDLSKEVLCCGCLSRRGVTCLLWVMGLAGLALSVYAAIDFVAFLGSNETTGVERVIFVPAPAGVFSVDPWADLTEHADPSIVEEFPGYGELFPDRSVNVHPAVSVSLLASLVLDGISVILFLLIFCCQRGLCCGACRCQFASKDGCQRCGCSLDVLCLVLSSFAIAISFLFGLVLYTPTRVAELNLDDRNAAAAQFFFRDTTTIRVDPDGNVEEPNCPSGPVPPNQIPDNCRAFEAVARPQDFFQEINSWSSAGEKQPPPGAEQFIKNFEEHPDDRWIYTNFTVTMTYEPDRADDCDDFVAYFNGKEQQWREFVKREPEDERGRVNDPDFIDEFYSVCPKNGLIDNCNALPPAQPSVTLDCYNGGVRITDGRAISATTTKVTGEVNQAVYLDLPAVALEAISVIIDLAILQGVCCCGAVGAAATLAADDQKKKGKGKSKDGKKGKKT